ncbi:MAG: hypothetical protein ABI477_20730 [Chryseolinea sp.]
MKMLGIICAMAICFAIEEANAQERLNKSHIKFPKPLISQISLQVGPMFSYPIIIKDPGRKRSVDVGVAATISVNRKFNDWFSVGASASYEPKGYKAIYHRVNEVVIPNREEKVIATAKLRYLSAAIVSRFMPFKRIPLYIGFGPYLGYLMKLQSVTEVYSSGKLLFKQTTAQKPSGFVNYDYGINAAVGCNVPLTANLLITVEGKYVRGLTMINKSYIGKVTNNAFAIVVGITLLR